VPDRVSFDLLRPARVTVEVGPEGLAAVRLLEWARAAGSAGLVHVARSDTRADRLLRALQGLAPTLEVLLLPPWDCVPYDRAGPSPEIMGRRIAALHRLTEQPRSQRLLITTIDAAMQRLPPRTVWCTSSVSFRVGQELQLDQLENTLLRLGYRRDERVDEPGEAAIRSEVVDVFPAGSDAPYRLDHSDGRITEIRRFDPLTQRTTDEVGIVRVDAASEVILAEPGERFQAIEHWLPQIYCAADTIFDYLPDAAIVLDPEVEDRRAGFIEQIADAYASRSALLGAGEESDRRRPLTPNALYLDKQEWDKRLNARTVIELTGDPGKGAVPRFAEMRDPSEAFGDFVGERLAAGDRVVLTAGSTGDLRFLERTAQRELNIRPARLEDWSSALAAAPGTIGILTAELTGGFLYGRVTVVAFADLAGVRTRGPAHQQRATDELSPGELRLRLGDWVIHLDHGMGILRGLETVEAGGAPSEVIKLEYAADTNLLAPIDEIGRIWRYGAEESGVTLDRLDGEGWAKRRAAVEEHVAKTAHALLALARAREKAAAPALVPPRPDYARFAARFPFAETEDQARAIEATLRDLASGKPMDRLVCGDVGFGKTEIALRGAAAAVLAGKQIALVAPTTVLVRQHLQTFRSRFAGFEMRVEALSRLSTPSEARVVRKGLANGDVRIVIGTHAVAGKQVRFQDLGLLIIDEEQRFGVRQKERLRALGSGIHVLTLTATPIPRTIQAAMVGLQQVSVIATPPARRQPIRTFLLPFEPVTMREALMREHRRGGQSFVVCPRIEDIAPMKERLAEFAPEMQVLTAHAKMPAAELDTVMVRFADGEGDLLLSTNIIENGLDIPRANTILIWRADRFGIAQLHQLRGRVGRGRVRGACYLLTDPAAKLAPATERRLRTLEALDRLGAGFAISAHDLDLRGAGDLIGEEQAGHIKLIGVELYQDLLQRAMAVVRGEDPPEDWTPELNFGLRAGIPASYVAEDEIRLNLYARLAQARAAREIEDFAAEIEDRFGPIPDEVSNLLALARLAHSCRLLGIAKIDGGPQAIALTFRRRSAGAGLEKCDERLSWRGERLVLDQPAESPEQRLRETAGLLRRFSRGQWHECLSQPLTGSR
jgi:transcription-repair coupling factor (superfamily II helicase)